MTLQAVLCLSKDQLSSHVARVLPSVSTSWQIPFGRRSGRSPSIREALEENSSRSVSVSVPYFARQRTDSAEGLRGFTPITEIHRETYNSSFFDVEKIDRDYRSGSTLVPRDCERTETYSCILCPSITHIYLEIYLRNMFQLIPRNFVSLSFRVKMILSKHFSIFPKQ